jgi:hypothetical protein
MKSFSERMGRVEAEDRLESRTEEQHTKDKNTYFRTGRRERRGLPQQTKNCDEILERDIESRAVSLKH